MAPKDFKVILEDRTVKPKGNARKVVILLQSHMYATNLVEIQGNAKGKKGQNAAAQDDSETDSIETQKKDKLHDLQEKYQCDKHHQKYCYILATGAHRHLKIAELSW